MARTLHAVLNQHRPNSGIPPNESASTAFGIIPAIAVAVIAVGGIRERAHYPALLAGSALPIVLSGLLDCVTWGWRLHATIMYLYDQPKGATSMSR